jgi:hypothetical protein
MRLQTSSNSALASARREPRLVVGLIYPTGSIYLTNKTGLSNVPGNVVYGCLRDISASSQTLLPDEGRSTIGTLSFSAVDLGADVTAELRSQLDAGRGPRGREVRVWTGDTDNFNDFERVETYVIDRAIDLDGRSYRFYCSDRTREQKVSIFEPAITRLDASLTDVATTITVQDTSAFELLTHTASFSDAPSSTVGYGLIKKTGEIFRYTGKTATSFTGVTRGAFNTTAQAIEIDGATAPEKRPEIIEFIYLEMPAPQLDYAIKTGKIKGTANVLPSGWHMGIDEAYLDGDSYDAIGTDLYDPSDPSAGLVLRFAYLQKTDGKKFCEEQLHLPAATFVQTTADGLLRIRRMVSLVSGASAVASLSEADVISHGVVQHNLARVINRARLLWNWNGERFTRESILYNQTSIDTHGASPLHDIELYGLHVSRHSTATVKRVFDSIIDRYGAPPIELSARLSRRHNVLEIADAVRLALGRVKDFTNPDSLDRTFEIQSRRINWRTGQLDVQLFGSTSRVQESDGGTTGPQIDDTTYTGTGGNLTGYLTISGGHVTASGSLTGGSDVRTSVFYYNGDLTIDSGVTVTISDNVQLRIKGTLTINGKIDGAGNGIAAPTDPNTVSGAFQGYPDPAANGAYLGSTNGGSGLWHVGSVYARNVIPATAVGINSAVPRLALEINDDGTTISGLPSDIRGTPGMYGQPVVASNLLNYKVGGAGGPGGAGLLIICRGLAFGVSGEIDLSGGDGSAPTGGSQVLSGVPVPVYAGGGSGGCPGALHVILDGDDVTYPDLSTTFTANHGTGAYLGTPGVESYVSSSLTFDGATGCGVTLPSGGVDMWQSAHMIQYMPQAISLGESDDEIVPAPTGLAATPDDFGVQLDWTSPPADLHDYVAIYESINNDRSNAVEISRGKVSSFYKGSDTAITRYYWIRAEHATNGVSAWEPAGSTAGVSATFGGAAATIDASTIVYRQSTAPTSPEEGWIWIDSDDSMVYRYSGVAWVAIAALDALLLTNAPAEGGADVTGNNADSIIFRQSTAPGSPVTGWIWVDTDDSNIYRYSGSVWTFVGSGDALLLANAAAEAGADVTGVHADDIIYYQGTAPGAPQEGWLWVDTDDGNVYRRVSAAWLFIGSADALQLTNAPAEAGADVTSNNADTIIYSSSTPPVTPQAGWIWVDTDDSLVYRYSGAAWVEITALDALLLTNAPAEAGADQTANNADAVIFRQSAAPGSPQTGWIWIDTDDSLIYRYSGSSWVTISALDALLLTNAPAEAGADQTANNADAIIFYQSGAPSTPQEGWIWVDTDDGNVYRRVGAAWVFIGSANALNLTNAPAESGADVTANNADAVIFRQATAPGSAQAGWLWIDTDDSLVYRYNGSSWVEIAALDALLLTNAPAEAGADQTANNADAIVFRQSTAPGSAQAGWLWVDTDDSRVYRYNGSSWEQISALDVLLLTNAPLEAGATSDSPDPLNLWPDPNFSRGSDWWISKHAQHSLVTDPLGIFAQVMQMTGTSTWNSSSLFRFDASQGDVIFREMWACKAAGATGSVAGLVIYMALDWLDDAEAVISTDWLGGVAWDDLTTAWQKFYLVSATAPANTVRVQLRIGNDAEHTGGNLYVAQPRMLRHEPGADVTANNADTVIYRQASAPGSPQTGWIWVDTDDSIVYRYNGSSWDEITALDALLLTNGPAEPGADVTQDHLALIDSIDWQSSITSPMGDWWLNGGSLANTVFEGAITGPFGESPPTLRLQGNATAPGWYSSWRHNFDVDPLRAHLVGVWFKVRNTATIAGVYVGLTNAAGYLESLSGVENTNYYFVPNAGHLFGAWDLQAGKWYLALAVIQPNTATVAADANGIYDPETGVRMYDAGNIRHQSGASEQYLRFGFYSTGTAYTSSDGVWFTRPFGFRMDGSEPSIQELLGMARLGTNQLPGLSSLLPNYDFRLPDTSGKPAGIRGIEGTTDRAQISYGDIGIKIVSTPDASVSFGFPAIPIDDTAQYILTIRHRSSASSATGLYLRWSELAGPLPAGKSHVGATDAESVTTYRTGYQDLVANGPMPGTTVAQSSYTYTPTPGTQFATFGFYNWTAFTGEYYVAWVQVTRINNAEAQIFYQATSPSSPRNGWIWVDTDDARVYRYNGSWVQIATNDVSTIGGLLVASQLAATMTFTQSLVISTGGHLRSGQTAFDTGVGYFLEYNGGNPRFSFGDSSGEKMIFDVSGSTIDLTQTETGSFTGTFYSWGSGTINHTIYYVRQGRLVTLYVAAAMTGTMNGTAMYMTGIPTALWPTQMQEIIGRGYRNNSINGILASAKVGFAAANRIDFYRLTTGSGEIIPTAWSNVTSCGITSDWTVSYYIDQ